MATCTQCGAELKPGTKFCENCGAKVSVPPPEGDCGEGKTGARQFLMGNRFQTVGGIRCQRATMIR